MSHVLLWSKFVLAWRRMTSSMRGCCHRPGVELAGEGCWCVVGVRDGEPLDCGVKLSFGRTLVDVADGEGAFGCAGEGTRLLVEDEERTRLLVEEEERTRAVVDMFAVVMLVW